MGGSIWQQAWDAARNILESVLGDLLGWLIVIAVLTLLVLLLYFVLKKMGWRGAYRDPYGNTRAVVRITLGQKGLGEEEIKQMLADPKAKVQTIRLDGSDPQARAKLHQIAQLLDSGDPNMREKLARTILADPAPPSNLSAVTAAPAAAVTLGGTDSVPEPSAANAGAVPASSSPTPATETGLPDWHQDLIQQWQREQNNLAPKERVPVAPNLQGDRNNLRALFMPVRYAAAALCATAALLSLIKASRGQPQFNVLALVLALCAGAAWRGLGPSRYD